MKSFIADKAQKISKLALKNVENLSFGALNKAFRERDVKVNGKRVDKDITVSVGDVIEIYFKEIKVSSHTVLFRDADVLIIDKKKGFESKAVFDEIARENENAFFIHRLDRNTDGIMVFALSEGANLSLLKGFKNHAFKKVYRTTVFGIPKEKEKTLTAYLKKDSENSLVKISDENQKGYQKIITEYKVVKENTDNGTSELLVILHTGKTHQIRAHLAHVGHFVVGDGKYGDNAFNKKVGARVQMLTAESLTFHFDKDDYLYYLDGKTFKVQR